MSKFTHIDHKTLVQYNDRFRARLVNSLSGFKSVNLIATRDKWGTSNLAIVSSVVHLGANPPLVGFIMRPMTVIRNTYDNIVANSQYTINQVSKAFWQQAHQTSARYDADVCEFLETGLTLETSPVSAAPFVAESQLKYSVVLSQIVDIEKNGTKLIIGEIRDIFCNATAICQDGYIDIEAIGTIAVSGLDSYHQTTRLSRLSYARPGSPLQHLDLNGDATIHNKKPA